MGYNFFIHTNIRFGAGTADAIPEIIDGRGLKKVMVVYDAGVKAAGIAEKGDRPGRKERGGPHHF